MKPNPDGREARRLLGQVLHGAQDYYAHTNWVDTNIFGVPDGRLALESFSAVPLATATCQAPPNTGMYVPFTGYTSGYWFGCSGKDDARLPAGKCYHGFSGPPTKIMRAQTRTMTIALDSPTHDRWRGIRLLPSSLGS
jgi:hypothetical protein